MSAHNFKNRLGERYGRLVVISQAESRRGANGIMAMWRCRCDCGNEVEVPSISLSRNKSCGCARIRHGAFIGRHKKRTPTYITWQSMIARCTNPAHEMFPRYGGSGVTICARWRDSFGDFRSDMGERPRGMTLDRVDRTKGYEPSNCRWATPIQQSANRRNTAMLTFSGVTLPQAEWARRLGMKLVTLDSRLRKGWSVERALTDPVAAAQQRIGGDLALMERVVEGRTL